MKYGTIMGKCSLSLRCVNVRVRMVFMCLESRVLSLWGIDTTGLCAKGCQFIACHWPTLRECVTGQIHLWKRAGERERPWELCPVLICVSLIQLMTSEKQQTYVPIPLSFQILESQNK